MTGQQSLADRHFRSISYSHRSSGFSGASDLVERMAGRAFAHSRRRCRFLDGTRFARQAHVAEPATVSRLPSVSGLSTQPSHPAWLTAPGLPNQLFVQRLVNGRRPNWLWNTICKRSSCVPAASGCKAESGNQLLRFNTPFIVCTSRLVYECRTMRTGPGRAPAASMEQGQIPW